MTPETNEQFLARMILCLNSKAEITGSDWARLNDLAFSGPGPVPDEVQPPAPLGVAVQEQAAAEDRYGG